MLIIRTQSQSPCEIKIPNLLCFKPNLYNNSKVLKGGGLSALMLGYVLVSISALSERGAFWGCKDSLQSSYLFNHLVIILEINSF